jgi:hypothetical protein
MWKLVIIGCAASNKRRHNRAITACQWASALRHSTTQPRQRHGSPAGNKTNPALLVFLLPTPTRRGLSPHLTPRAALLVFLLPTPTRRGFSPHLTPRAGDCRCRLQLFHFLDWLKDAPAEKTATVQLKLVPSDIHPLTLQYRAHLRKDTCTCQTGREGPLKQQPQTTAPIGCGASVRPTIRLSFDITSGTVIRYNSPYRTIIRRTTARTVHVHFVSRPNSY